MGLFEAACHQLDAPNTFIHVAKHVHMARLPFQRSVFVHTAHNVLLGVGLGFWANALLLYSACFAGVSADSRPMMFTRAIQAYMREEYHRPRGLASTEALPVGAYTFPSRDSLALRGLGGDAPMILIDPDIKVVQGFPRMDFEPRARGQHYSIITPFCGVGWYVPARTDHHLLTVMQARILRPPPCQPAVQEAFWTSPAVQAIKQQWFEQLPTWSVIHSPDHAQEWLAHFTEKTQKTRYKRALAERNLYGRDSLMRLAALTKIEVKCNELLIKPSDEPVKPRALWNVNCNVQAVVGPAIFEYTKRFKQQYNMNNMLFFTFNEFVWTITVTYGGASNDVELSAWYNEAHARLVPRSAHVIVAGDDSLVVMMDSRGVVMEVEGDASMYDQSQSHGPLAFEDEHMERFGVCGLVRDLLYATNSGRVVGHFRDWDFASVKAVFDLHDRPERSTGSSTTSVGNSLNMAFPCVGAVIASDGDTMEYTDIFRQFGYQMKFKFHSEPGHATFLKGMWLPTTDGSMWWCPLPSRVLKIGKSLQPLHVLYSGRVIREHLNEDRWHDIARAYLGEVCEGYRAFVLPPILSDYVAMFPHLGGRPKVRPEPWKVQAGLGPKPTLAPNAIYPLCHRYGTTEREIAEAISLFRPVPFILYSHPLFFSMAHADYY